MAVLFGGIDIPVYETFFIISIVFFAGIVIMILGVFYIFKGLKQIKDIVNKLKADVDEFEEDLHSLTGVGEKKVSNEKKQIKSNKTPGIKEYIKDSLDRGFPWVEVRQVLIKQGWDEKELEEIHSKI